MNEFICKVVLDNQISEIKTYANSILEAFDNLVCMDGIKDIVSVENKETLEVFHFDGELHSLKKMRDLIDDENLIFEEINDSKLNDFSYKTH